MQLLKLPRPLGYGLALTGLGLALFLGACSGGKISNPEISGSYHCNPEGLDRYIMKQPVSDKPPTGIPYLGISRLAEREFGFANAGGKVTSSRVGFEEDGTATYTVFLTPMTKSELEQAEKRLKDAIAKNPPCPAAP